MTLPAWMAEIAGLDDDALAAASNKGLVRRAVRVVERVALSMIGADGVTLACDGATVRLLPGGVGAARCDCPVAGVCVHIVATCLWTRSQEIDREPHHGSGESQSEPRHGSLRDSSVPADTASRRPEASTETSGGRRGQRIDSLGAAADLATIIESLVADGVSQLAPASIDRLARAGERARLDDLGLLARLTAQAVGNLRSHLRRDDTVTESDCLSTLAQAWQLARVLADDPEPSPELIGARTRKGDQADIGELMPLAVRWWRNPDGARGVRLHAFDLRHGRLEEATNGRAAGADPGFQPGWELSLLWGVSPSLLSSGILSLTGAERRSDGTLSASGRTRVEARPWGDLDLSGLAQRVNVLSDGAARTAFGAAPDPLRLVVPRPQFGLGTIEVDEVEQLLVWPIVDEQGRTHRLSLPATEHNGRLLTWLAEHRGLRALTVIGSRPEAAFIREKGEVRLLSLTLSRIALGDGVPSLVRRLLKRDQHRRAAPTPTPPSDLVRLCDACADVVDALGATGRRSLTPRQAQTLSARAAQADDLGLATLANALREILASPSPSSILWARFVLDRLGQLVS
ncbi:hypothetical protein [Tessaracoccus caeni]|uniref:hypothetical protein n=1 Tax=Tessaracoccus caeni TaxID=3031239 RepID=UPI0023DCE210|nr:hypothetical protein [Tessaracoccus caeni]MDF1488950.1 hypothetical protein [Tessaracoccus caeni]